VHGGTADDPQQRPNDHIQRIVGAQINPRARHARGHAPRGHRKTRTQARHRDGDGDRGRSVARGKGELVWILRQCFEAFDGGVGPRPSAQTLQHPSKTAARTGPQDQRPHDLAPARCPQE